VRKTDFFNAYFWSDDYAQTNSVVLQDSKSEFYLYRLFPQYEVEKGARPMKGEALRSIKKKVMYMFLDEFMHEEFLATLTQQEEDDLNRIFKPKKGKYHRIMVVDSAIIDYASYTFCPYYVATIDDAAGNGYGKGDGLNTMGSILNANLTAGSQTISLLKLQNPNFMKAVQCGLVPTDPALQDMRDTVDPRPGATTNVSDDNGANATLTQPISALVQPASDPGSQLQHMIVTHENSKKEVTEGYQTSAYIPGEPVPNEREQAVITRLAQSIRTFHSKSDVFKNNLLIPIVETIVGQFDAKFNYLDSIVKMASEYEIQLQRENIKFDVVIESSLNEQEKELRRAEFDRELMQRSGAMQFFDQNSEDGGGGALFQKMNAKLDSFYPDK
jgi:hypothetical protein